MHAIFSHPKVRVIRAPSPLRAGQRWVLADSLQLENIIVLDDDIALEARQLNNLFDVLDHAPERPHGVIGSRFSDNIYYDAATNRSLNTYHLRETGIVDVIHQVYAVTQRHVQKFLKLEVLLKNYSLSDPASVGDDIVISHCGSKSPIIHDLGALRDLPGAWDPEIAVHCEAGFNRKRAKLLMELAAHNKESQNGT